MTWHRLRARDVVLLAAAVVVGRLWIQVDQELLPQRLLLPAFFGVVLLLLAAFFAVVRPPNAFALARTVALVLGVVVTALIILQHVILTFDLSYKSGIVLGGTVVLPFAVAAGYKWLSR